MTTEGAKPLSATEGKGQGSGREGGGGVARTEEARKWDEDRVERSRGMNILIDEALVKITDGPL